MDFVGVIICNKLLSVQKTGTTAHLWLHWQSKHPQIHSVAKDRAKDKAPKRNHSSSSLASGSESK